MNVLHSLIESHVGVACAVLALAFLVLARCADLFVENAVAIANRLCVPKLVIGIVLVSLCTTTPELSVSVLAAAQGNAEMALGNAIGSVICDDGVGLALAGLFTTAPILVQPRVLRTSGVFLAAVCGLSFFFVARDYSLTGGEGAMLLLVFALYLAVLYRSHRRGHYQEDVDMELIDKTARRPLGRGVAVFILGLAGILFASDLIVVSATTLARGFGIPESVIALTLVAMGTSIPEFATCVVAARKGHGALAVGNILGADILNITWIAGASSLVNDLTLGRKEVYFMFPWMFVIVATMLGLLRWNYSLTRGKGLVLLALYLLYLVSFVVIFPPQR